MVDFVSCHSSFAMVRVIFIIINVALFEFSGACFGQLEPVSIDTPYSHITIERIGSIVEMRSFWRSKVYRESAVDLNDKSRLVVPYTAFVGASAIFHPSPKNVLMIGLGGGGFNQFFEKAFPSATLESVELDPQVVALAQKYLGFKPSERDKVIVSDGRMFLRHSKMTYNLIILDAFRGGFVPPHLKTVEFYKLAQSHITPDGLFVANVRTDTALFASDIRTMRTVFPQLGIFAVPQTENAVLVAANFASPTLESMLKEAGRISFNDTFRRSIDPATAVKFFRITALDLNRKAPLLTDDFAPTEFLDAMKNNHSAR
jgi:spermidine synthase